MAENQPFYNLYKNIQGCDTTASVIENSLCKNECFSMYPNPATSTVTIEFLKHSTDKYELKIYNIFGQLVYTQKNDNNSGTLTFDISPFKAGIYFVCITSGNKTIYDNKLIILK